MNYQETFSEIFNSLKVGSIIVESFKYYRVKRFSKSDKTFLTMNLIDFTLEEVRFDPEKWEWVTVGEEFEGEHIPLRIEVAKPVDYVLLGDNLFDHNGNSISTYLDIDPEDFEDSEYKVRYMSDTDINYSAFRKEYHIIDKHNTIISFNEEKLEKQKESKLNSERARKLSFLD